MRTELCREYIANIRTTVWAEIIGECLTITGQDIGYGCIEQWGKEDHNYSYKFDPANTTKLYHALSKGVDQSSLMHLIVEFLSGKYGCNRLEETCKKNNITYLFSSW